MTISNFVACTTGRYAARINEPGITQATSRSPGAGAGSSGLLLVVHVPDNVGNVLVAVLLLLDKGGVAQGRALDEDLAIEMLARGLSVRDIEDAFKDESVDCFGHG
jgi:hypothetical protein